MILTSYMALCVEQKVTEAVCLPERGSKPCTSNFFSSCGPEDQKKCPEAARCRFEARYRLLFFVF